MPSAQYCRGGDAKAKGRSGEAGRGAEGAPEGRDWGPKGSQSRASGGARNLDVEAEDTFWQRERSWGGKVGGSPQPAGRLQQPRKKPGKGDHLILSPKPQGGQLTCPESPNWQGALQGARQIPGFRPFYNITCFPEVTFLLQVI